MAAPNNHTDDAKIFFTIDFIITVSLSCHEGSMFDRPYDYDLNRHDIEDRKFLWNIKHTLIITLSCRRKKQIAIHERFMIVITRRISPNVSWRIRPRIAVNERDQFCERLALCADKTSGRLLHTCIDTIIVSHVARIRCLRVFVWARAINLFFSD